MSELSFVYEMIYTQPFIKAVEFVLKWEGGEYENDPDDPGGATKWGIDKRSHPDVDIRHLSKDQAIAIYHKSYWNRILGDGFEENLAIVMMDISVNNGVSRAIRWTQEFASVVVDGIIGPITLAAANLNARSITESLLDRREQLYRDIAKGKMAKYLRGWLNRNNDLRQLVA